MAEAAEAAEAAAEEEGEEEEEEEGEDEEEGEGEGGEEFVTCDGMDGACGRRLVVTTLSLLTGKLSTVRAARASTWECR